ncbi:metallophosphoesterase [Staphylococcus simulans]|uniref:metallophosphoesterase n=1 Tax=Staphylococcus simulans TaxID=1286 RepID=UPI00399A6872
MKIMQLTDLHIGSQPFSEEDQQTFKIIENLVEKYKADIIVITGDLISSKEPDSLNTFKKVIDFFDQLNVPFAVTLGNHDSEADYNRADLWKIIDKSKMHVKREGGAVLNDCYSYFYTLENGIRIYMLDAGDYARSPFEGVAFVTCEQQKWLVNRAKNRTLPDQLFMHMPLPEYADAAEKGYVGNHNEPVSVPCINSGLWYKLFYNTTIKAVYCGHDHNNDFSSNYYGIQLNYGRVTGENSYGLLKRGARMIEWDDKLNRKTYIVEADDDPVSTEA